SKGAGLETWYYTFDDANRLTNILQTSDGTTTLLLLTYTYDVQDNRVEEDEWKSGVTTTTRFVYDAPGSNVVIDTDGNNTPLARRMYGDATDQVLVRCDRSE